MNPILAIEWGMFGVFLTSFVLLAFFTMIKPIAPIYEMKSLFASKAVIGALIALAAKVWGLKTGDLSPLYDIGLILWPIIVGIGADCMTMWHRIAQTTFTAPPWKTWQFWGAIISGLTTIFGAFGVDIHELDGIAHKVIDNSPAFVAIAASLVSLFGTITAKKEIKMPIVGGQPVIMLALLLSVSGVFAEAPRQMGWRSNPTHSKGLKQMSMKAVPLPAAASLEALMPAVYDQTTMGSCTANTGAGAFDYRWKLDTGSFCYPSRLDLYQNELKHDGTFPQDAGSYTASILWVLKNQGIALEKCWPYVPSNLAKAPTTCAISGRKSHKAIVAYDIPNDDGGYGVKYAISQKKLPVLTGGYVFNNIMVPIYDVGTRKWFVGMPKGNPVGGHEVLIVGYDDGLVIAGIKGWVRVRNSWGTDWGDKGYAWFPQKYLLNPKYFEDNGAIELTTGTK